VWLRLGETLGRKWDDVGPLAAGEVRIRQQLQVVKKQLVLQELKTDKSRRTLALPEVCVDALRTYRTRQLEQSLKAGADWTETGLVFTTARRGRRRQLGTALHPRNVLRILHAMLDEAGLPRMRFHELRHTADLYGHLVKQTSAKAARHMDAVLQPCQGVS
jgi:integrase